MGSIHTVMATADQPNRPRPGRPSMRVGARTAPAIHLILRNIGLAFLADHARRPMSAAEIAAASGLPESTIRQAIQAGRPLVAALMGHRERHGAAEVEEESIEDLNGRRLRNARRRRTKWRPVNHEPDE